MPISMSATSSQYTDYRLGNFGLEIRKRLAKVSERLSLFFSAIIIKRMERRELENRETHQDELGYEATKRKLLVALRDKIAEKQAEKK